MCFKLCLKQAEFISASIKKVCQTEFISVSHQEMLKRVQHDKN